MSDSEARKIAERFIEEQKSRFKYEFLCVVRLAHLPDEVSVNFSVASPEGVTYDGPVVVIVSETSGSVRFFNS